jgi:hypothetical protein
MRRLLWLVPIAGLYALGGSANAHHAFAAVFDKDVPVELSGTVTQVEWMNPHVWFYIDVKNDSGETENWGLEMGSPNSLVRRGWRSTTLEAGTPVKVHGFRAKDGTKRGAVETVTLESGQRLFGAQDKSR